jgi:hypothetical protein
MRSEFIAVHMLNAAGSVRGSVGELADRTATFSRAVSFCGSYRQVAISSLLIQGLPDDFFENLFRSGRAFAFFLENAGDPEHHALSRMTPFFDAVACCDDEGALRIARASKRQHNQDLEYLDDFLHFSFLMSKFYLDASLPELEAILAKWEQLLVGQLDPRFDLCRGLLAADAGLIENGLLALAAKTQARAKEAAKFQSLPDEELFTSSNVSVEALALIRWAERIGIRVPEHVPLVPAVLRPPIQPRFDPDGWRKPVRVLGQQLDENVMM